jgi:hypothetical protein
MDMGKRQFNPVAERIIIGRVDIPMFRPKGRYAGESETDDGEEGIICKNLH